MRSWLPCTSAAIHPFLQSISLGLTGRNPHPPHTQTQKFMSEFVCLLTLLPDNSTSVGESPPMVKRICEGGGGDTLLHTVCTQPLNCHMMTQQTAVKLWFMSQLASQWRYRSALSLLVRQTLAPDVDSADATLEWLSSASYCSDLHKEMPEISG